MIEVLHVSGERLLNFVPLEWFLDYSKSIFLQNVFLLSCD